MLGREMVSGVVGREMVDREMVGGEGLNSIC